MKSDSVALNEVYPENQKDFFPALLFFLAVIGQNIGVFYLMKRWISLSEVSMLLFIIVYLAKSPSFEKRHLGIYLLFNTFNFLNILTADSKTEALIATVSLMFYSTFTLFFVTYIIHEDYYNEIISSFLLACYALAIYGITQFIVIRVVGFYSKYIVYPFGSATVQIQPGLTSPLAARLWRSNSLYYEPSIYGMTLVLGLSINEVAKMGRKLFKGITILGIIVSFSTTAYIMLVTVYLLTKIFGNSLALTLKNVIIIIMIITIILLVIPYAIDLSELLPYPFNRITEVFYRGTSGYYRLVTPVYVTGYVLANEPLGIGVGNIDSYLDSPPQDIKHYLKMGGSYGKSIDSVPFVILINYGYLGFIVLALLFSIISKSMKGWFPFSVSFMIYIFGTGNYSSANFWVIFLLQLNAIIMMEQVKAPKDAVSKVTESY